MNKNFTCKHLIIGIIFLLGGSVFAQTPKLPIGMNIHGTNYYDQSPYLTDVMKTSSDWLTFNATGSSAWDTKFKDAMPRDANGYPLKVPFTPPGAVPQGCRFLFNNYYSGKYVLLHDGIGRFKISGVANTLVSTGKVYLDLTGAGNNTWMDIYESQEGNHIRNIRILPVQYENAPASAPTFVQGFLDGLKPFHAIRFMDWTRTNNSNQEVWSDRASPTSYSQAAKGTSIEYAIELCNLLKTDAWFCTPHKADDDYIKNFARLVRDKLDPSLKVYIECSNEMWNWQFQQAKYVLDNAPGHRNSYVSQALASLGAAGVNHPEKDAYMMARTFNLWTAEFGTQAPTRLVRVATGQHGYTATSKRILEYLFKVNKTGCDMYSVGGYFNYDKADHTKWLATCGGTLVTPAEILESAARKFETAEKMWTLQTAEHVNQYPGVKYSVYEGGQHMQPHNQEVHCYNQAVYDAQIHPGIYDMYMKNFKNHIDPTVNCQLFMAFSYASEREDRYGSWGHLENFNQLSQDLMKVAPKYKALLDANAPKGTPPPVTSLRTPENPTNVISGVDYKYFEGTWSLLPAFSSLTSVSSGNLAGISLSPAARTDNFGFRYTGFIDVPADGEYTFYTSSDDGSKFYIGTTTVVDNDGLHGTKELSGKIGLKKGKHAMALEFFENTGGQVLELRYSGPGIAKMLIPNTSLFRTAPVNQKPAVAITSPAANAEFTEGASVSITASASDTDGTVSKVEFFAGSTKIGEDISSPYAVSWTTTTAGTYSLTARATDNNGAISTSAARSIIISVPMITLPDLIVTSISWLPATPKIGDSVRFSITIKNIGAGSTPSGVVSGAGLAVNGSPITWAAYREVLISGQSATVTAVADWLAVAGTHVISANIDDINRMQESNETNNILTTNLTIALPVPTGLASSAIGQTGFTLSWTAAGNNAGVTAYEVFRNGVSIDATSTPSFAVTGLSAGTTYAMTVRARDAAGNWSAQSTALNVTTTSVITTCGAITNNGLENGLIGWTNSGSTAVSADAHSGSAAAVTGPAAGGFNYGTKIPASGGQTITFSAWAKVSGSPSWAGIGFDYLDAAGVEISEEILSINTTAYTEYSLTSTAPAGTASINVWTWKSGTTGNLFMDDFCLTVTGDVQAPSVPAGLVSSNITASSFTLSWNASADNAGVTGYEIFRNGVSIGTASTTSFGLTGLSGSTTYAMTVRARDVAGNWSAQSAALNVTTKSAIASCGAITNNGLESSLTGWTNTGSTVITSDAHSGSAAAVTGPAAGGFNYDAAIPATSGQTINLSAWAKVSGTTSMAAIGFDYRDAAGVEISEEILNVTATAYTEYTLTATAPAGTASINVWTWKSGTTGNFYMDDFCLTVSGSVDTQAPSIPAGLASSNITASSFTLSWNASTDNVGVTAYELFRNGVSVGTATSRSMNLTGMSASTTYSMRVRARDAAGNWSAQSAALNVTTSGGTASYNVTINKSIQHQTIDGFGFFGGMNTWWSSSSSLWSDAWGDQVINDLGITIWRTEYYPPADQYSGQDADWNKQLPVIRGLKAKANLYGVDLKYIFTVWSPPSSMKIAVENNVRMSGTPHPYGAKKGGALDPAKYVAFGNWLKSGIQFFKNEGIDVYAISPQNEPYFVHYFNSCFYKQEWYPQMLNGAMPTVKAAYPNVKIFGSENMLEMEAASHNWPWFFHKKILDDPTARNNFDILAVHGYSDGVAPSSGSVLGQYWANHKLRFQEPMKKSAWMTETSGYEDSWTSTKGAFSLGLDMMSGLNNGNMTGWVWWQGSESPGSTSGVGDYALMNGLVKGKKYYVSKQYYRYIRPGAVRVEASSNNSNVSVSAYQHTGNGTHTIVLTNTSTSAQNITLGGAGLPGSFVIFRTSATDNCAQVGTYTTGTSLSLPASCIVTLQAGGTPLASAGAIAAASEPDQMLMMAPSDQQLTQVYPNPVESQPVTVDISRLQRTGAAEIALADMEGNKIKTYTVHGNILEIPQSDFPMKGIYLLTVDTGITTESIKLSVQ